MMNRIGLIIFFLISFNAIAFDKVGLIEEAISLGKYDEVIMYLEPIVDNGNPEQEDYSFLIFSQMAKGDYKNALTYSNKWLNESRFDGDTLNLLKASRYKTAVLYNLGDLEGSIESANYTLGYYSRTDSVGITKTKLRLGLFYYEKKEYDRAYEVYRKIDYENVLLADREDEYFTNFGIIHAKQNNLDSSIYFFKRSLLLVDMDEDPFGYVLGYSNIASSYIDLKKYDQALIYLDSTALPKLDRFDPVFELVYQNYYSVYSKMGEADSALAYIKRLKDLNQVLLKKRMEEEMEELDKSYRREASLKTKIVQSDRELEKSKQLLLVSIIVILLVIIVTGGALLLLRFKNLKANRDNLLVTQRLLRSQITPHFLYNSLTTIQGMILQEKNNLASSYLSKFSRLVRLILENSRDKVVVLSAEIEVVKYYLDLQNARFSETFEYSIRIDEDVDEDELFIPPMLMQPFVENSIEHGFKGIDRKGIIDIHIYFDQEALVCKIVDNGVGLDQTAQKVPLSKKESLSTSINSERIHMLSKEFKTPSSLEIIDRKVHNEEGTIVTLIIPYLYD